MSEVKEVVTVPVQLDVPKESKEVADFLVGLYAAIQSGKEMSVIIAEELPKLMTAIQGYELLSEENKGKHLSATIAYLVEQIGNVLGK